MAEIDGMFILRRSGRPKSGAAFGLGGVCRLTALEKLGGGWEVEVRDGSRIVVARGGSASTYEDARDEALRMANAGLDLLSMKGSADLGIADAVDSHIVWWLSDQGTVLRVSSVATLTAAVSVPAVVATDAQGNVVPPPRQRRQKWDDSFTYFRQAQLTDDLFDAFRNIYLAIEAILSSIIPPNPKEGESKWLERALLAVHPQLVDLASFAPAGAPDPVATVNSELRDARNAVFHAKSNRRHFMPQKWADRTSVSEALRGMARLYLRLMEAHLGFTRPSSFLYPYGADYFTRYLDRAVIHVTDDPAPFHPGQESINPSGGRVAPLPTRRAPELEQSFLKCFLGRVPGTQLSALTHVARAVATVDDVPVIAAIPDGYLTLQGFDWFECQLGIRINNKHQPRQDYPA